MRRPPAVDLTRRFPTIAITVAAFVAVFAVLVGDVEERYIYTFAGNGEGGSGGDGGPATEAQFTNPRGLTVDGSGNVYVSDSRNHLIRRIDPEGVITTIAGTGEWGYSGDDGPATEAQLNWPWGLVVDGSSNLYVADSFNNRIRRIDPEGIITTIAGTGERGYSGDDGPATEAQFTSPRELLLDGSGSLYVADSFNNRIRRIDPEGIITTIAGTGERGYSGDGGPATEAQFAFPIALALDESDNLYVADSSNFRVRRIDAEGVIVTVAGTGVWGYGGDGGPAGEAQIYPTGLALDEPGNLYVADTGSQRVRVIRPPGERNPVTQEFPQFANGDSTVSDLVLVNVDTKTVTPVIRFYGSMGDPISADSVVDMTEDLELAEDGALTVAAGIPSLGERTISTHGQGVLTTGSVRVVSDGYVGGVLRFDSMAVGVAGVGAAEPVNDAMFPARRKEGGINTGAAIRNLESDAMTLTCHLMQGGEVLETVMVELAGDGQQARFINELFQDADTSDFTGSVRCIAPEGKKFSGVVLEMDTGNRIFTTLPVVAVDAKLRSDIEEPYIFTIAGTGEGGFGGDGGPATAAQIGGLASVAVDGSGNVYVTDIRNQRIRRIDAEGVITTIAGTGERGYSGDGGPATEAQFNSPASLAVDGSGNVYVADLSNRRIRRIDAEGVITTIAGTGEPGSGGDGGPATEAQLVGVWAVAVDGSDNVYVYNGGDDRIRRIDAEGVITTIAGTGDPGYGGDGGPAMAAQFNNAQGLAVDGLGNVYVADNANRRVRVIRPPGERSPVTHEFPQFANGGNTASDLVLVNVDTKTVAPIVRFYDLTGEPVSADSVVEVTDDLELAADGALTVTAGIPPLGERTISTHGQGALTTGSVRVVSDGYTGGVLRFDNMAVGVAGVRAAEPVNDALFPARRQEGGINTGAAIRNLASEATTLTCHLMQAGEVLETAMVELAGGGQQARFINEMFPDADTAEFTGSVRCTAPEGKKFTGVALEMDIQNRIFTTLPLVPVGK